MRPSDVVPGIIPAYAGSTAHRRYPASPPTDHPRIRGEHCEKRHIFYRHLGSSPHTRGAPVRSDVRSSGARIIPAYAGSTPYHIIEVPAE